MVGETEHLAFYHSRLFLTVPGSVLSHFHPQGHAMSTEDAAEPRAAPPAAVGDCRRQSTSQWPPVPTGHPPGEGGTGRHSSLPEPLTPPHLTALQSEQTEMALIRLHNKQNTLSAPGWKQTLGN